MLVRPHTFVKNIEMNYRFFLILFLVTSQLRANNTSESQNKVKYDHKMDSSIQTIIKIDSSKTKHLLDSLYKVGETKCKREKLEPEHWMMVFSPTVIILFFALLLMINLYRKKDFSITKLVSLESDQKVLSTSRFIAFLTGLAAIFIGTTMTMYYGYLVVAECPHNPSVDGLWKILLGLGIGVVPYGINVFNKNEKEENANTNSTSNSQQ